MKYYLVAGEASGDLHGSNLMKEILKKDPQAEFRFWGGDQMAAVGGTLVSHYKLRAFMGISEVLKNIRSIAGFLNQAKADIAQWKPDALVLIDNPGFNLRIAPFAKSKGIVVHYYIAPKVWAWNKRRVIKLQKYVDFLYTILPFEIDFFAPFHLHTDYVGNPVVDAISYFYPDTKWKEKNEIDKPVIALLPGSRKNEIERILPYMLQMPKHFPQYQFVVAAAPSFSPDFFQSYPQIDRVKLCFGQTYEILAHADAALVASGTATLETALFKVPQVVCYRVGAITYFLGKMLVKLQWFGLVNLILNRGLLTELLQEALNEERLKEELEAILDGSGREKVLQGYEELREKLGGTGASARTAEFIVSRTINLPVI